MSAVRTSERKLRQAVAAKDVKAADAALSTYMSGLSKAACKGVVKRATVARKMSRLSSLVDTVRG